MNLNCWANSNWKLELEEFKVSEVLERLGLIPDKFEEGQVKVDELGIDDKLELGGLVVVLVLLLMISYKRWGFS